MLRMVSTSGLDMSRLGRPYTERAAVDPVLDELQLGRRERAAHQRHRSAGLRYDESSTGLPLPVPGGETRAMLYVANALAAAGEGRQLLSSLEKALLECPEVNELFADRDTLKVVVEGLGQE
jgi:hypothetical protein